MKLVSASLLLLTSSLGLLHAASAQDVNLDSVSSAAATSTSGLSIPNSLNTRCRDPGAREPEREREAHMAHQRRQVPAV